MSLYRIRLNSYCIVGRRTRRTRRGDAEMERWGVERVDRIMNIYCITGLYITPSPHHPQIYNKYSTGFDITNRALVFSGMKFGSD